MLLGADDGMLLGEDVGMLLGADDGMLLGADDGCELGLLLGDVLGAVDGCALGALLGNMLGADDGCALGAVDGCELGADDGCELGALLGNMLGADDGCELGADSQLDEALAVMERTGVVDVNASTSSCYVGGSDSVQLSTSTVCVSVFCSCLRMSTWCSLQGKLACDLERLRAGSLCVPLRTIECLARLFRVQCLCAIHAHESDLCTGYVERCIM
jgi:uncharacterized membrane protein